jgi:Xaa-Pro dipeptidase
MSMTALSPSPPMSSGEIQAVDFERAEEVARRHELLAEYLHLKGFDCLLLQDPANFAWLTCGGNNTRQGGSVPVAAILVTPDARVVLANNVDAGQLFDRELNGLGFLLKERPWTEAPHVLREDVCRGRKTASDSCLPGTRDVREELVDFRKNHTQREVNQFREVGRLIAHAVEATARNFEPGASEADVAGHLAYRLLRHQVEPVRIQVMADAQGWRYRHWAYGADRIERHCVISAVGRMRGLHAGATRTVCIGSPSEELQEVHHLATLIQATGIYFTQAGWSMQETWKRVARIYEKFGVPDEWRCAEQASLIGYRDCEATLLPAGAETFRQQTAVFWHPSVRSSQVGDTMLVGAPSGDAEHPEQAEHPKFEILTPMQNWPVLGVRVKGMNIERPGILIREVLRQ